MTNEHGSRDLTAAEKHNQARAFALSGTLSKFQQAKQRKALENKLLSEKNLPVRAATSSSSSVKHAKPTVSSTSSAASVTRTTTTTSAATTTEAAPPPLTLSIGKQENQATTSTTSAEQQATMSAADVDDPKKWPSVEYREWQYVYICNGPFEGKFGYYDDHQAEGNALIYFGMPMVGDGPYEMPLQDLRKPPAKYCETAFTAM